MDYFKAFRVSIKMVLFSIHNVRVKMVEEEFLWIKRIKPRLMNQYFVSTKNKNVTRQIVKVLIPRNFIQVDSKILSDEM